MIQILQATGLSKHFGGVHAVKNLDLELHEGETLSIIGPNGAGKTTLFNLLAGSVKPDSGSIYFENKDISRFSPARRAKLGIIRSFQHGRTFANLSVRENLLMGMHTRRLAQKRPLFLGAVELVQSFFPFGSLRAQERDFSTEAATLAALFGERLSPRLEEPAYLFSYANRRRIEIARCLAASPKILLLDEPSAGMNPKETEELIAFLQTLKARGQTMVIIEHKLPLVMQLSDRVIVMDDGENIAEGPALDVAHNPRVIQAYLGSNKVLRKRPGKEEKDERESAPLDVY